MVASGCQPSPNPPTSGPPLAQYDFGGLKYSLRLVRLHSSKPFSFFVQSAHVEVRLNLDHPVAAALVAQTGTPLPAVVEAMFISWVVLEVEAGNGKRVDRIQGFATDWCRVFAGLMSGA